MDTIPAGCHLAAVPYPGRGHINPMMNLCKLLASGGDDILITFIVTEEWVGLLDSEIKPDNIRFGSIPNILPSERVRGANVPEFFEAVMTKMVDPSEKLLDGLEPPVTTIIADTMLFWAVRMGNRRKIPVVSFWPMSAAAFSQIRTDLLAEDDHFPVFSSGDQLVDDISRHLSSAKYRNNQLLSHFFKIFLWVSKAQYLVLSTIYDLESQVVNALKETLPFPIYTVGPLIPYFKLGDYSISTSSSDLHYLKWLDFQPPTSVLFICLGSFLPISKAQMDEIAGGLRDSGVRFLWVAREEAWRLKEICGEMGMVVDWCDQLRVLTHGSVCGFWSHCGWGSTVEGLFAGVPFLTFPIGYDQKLNSKLIVEDWKIGWRVKREVEMESVVIKRDEIGRLVRRFVDLEKNEGNEMKRRVRELKEMAHAAVKKGGSSDTDIHNFASEISTINTHKPRDVIGNERKATES